MGVAIFSGLQYLWPFRLWKVDDLKISNRLVDGLSIPEQTKQFVFAFCEPETGGVVYVLAAQNLSRQSVVDTTCLIKEVKPRAVFAQVAPSALQLQKEESVRNFHLSSLPTSWFSVVKECFVNKISKQDYESLAESQIIKAIFGVDFNGHLLAAKNAAEETGSQFIVVESLSGRNADDQNVGSASANSFYSYFSLLQPNGLVSGKMIPSISSISKRFIDRDNLQPQMMNSLVSALSYSIPEPSPSQNAPHLVMNSEDKTMAANYQAPSFAQSVYLLLTDLHDIFVDLPSIKKAFFYAQKMLVNVHKGEPIDSQLLASVYNFRLAVEGLRIALNGVARDPKVGINSSNTVFNDLSTEEKCHAVLAHALKTQAKKYSTVVAIVDASSLIGLRRYWKTTLPCEFQEQMAYSLISDGVNNESMDGPTTRMKSLSEKPVVAVGAGATAIIGATSFSKAVPISALAKTLTVNIPASLKFGLLQTQRTLAIGLAKVFGPSKILAPWIGSSGAKVSAMKAAVSAEKFRAVAHSLVASAERSSLVAMRTAFYEIMRRRGRTIGARPLIAFGCSVATCSGLLYYGDGIECAAESAPSAHSIASMGRGLRSLQETSETLSCGDGKMQEALKSLRTRLKNFKL